MEYRNAGPADAPAIAALHADSWRRHYRGSFPDAYLDGDVEADRRAVWRDRLAAPDPEAATVVALDGGTLVGFVHTIFDDDPVWGALVDNLHVTAERKRGGLGTGLMARAAAGVLARPRSTGLYLWVLEANLAAQRFYARRGGVRSGDEWSDSPGGGRVHGLRYAWPDASVLLEPAPGGDPARADPGHDHRRHQLHRHRTPVRLPDGTEVTAVSYEEGDPYARDRPPDYGLYLDARWRPPWPHDHVAWPDFGLPADPEGLAAKLGGVLARARAGARVEIGCVGAHGRTGTALGCLAVLCGHPAADAVAWVRVAYCPGAVETEDQAAFVAAFRRAW